MSFYTLQCVSCGKKWKEEETCTTCKVCGNAIDIHMDMDFVARRLNRFSLEHAPLSAAKYMDFYPIDNCSKVITLGEGNTPLYHAKKIGEKVGIKNLFIKNEGHNPTGVFKDRGTMVEITKALELNAKAICVASTGNMAASVAAYSSQAGLPCYVFVPEGTPIGKLSQTLSYGGTLVQVRGLYADCVELAQQLAEKNNYYLAGDYAFRAEGAKSTAFEIIEQLHWQVPDVVIIPVGCGTNLAGIWKGFQEFYTLGLIEKMPRIIGVQPTGCDTICGAFQKHDERFTFVAKPNTIASAVGIGVPQDDIKCMHAIRASKGTTETATDNDILEAQRTMAKEESVFTEPSGAIPIATLPSLLKKNIISQNDVVVCVATGTGLKDPKAAISSFSEPPSIDPDIQSVEQYLKTGMPAIQRSKTEEDTAIFTSFPDEKTVIKATQKYFDYTPESRVLENMMQEILALITRGKNICKGDLLSILEESIENTSIPESPLKILYYKSTNARGEKPHGTITLLFEETEETAESDGVGPVDALIKAMHIAVNRQTDFWPELKDFHVDVATGKESALVKVRMEMVDKEGNQVSAKASSPDIIVASINAFGKGFNLLYQRNT